MLSENPYSCDEDDELLGAASISSNSDSESSSSDLTEDATSSPNPPPSFRISSSSLPPRLETEGPLYELSSLMKQLPIKRGLSNFYQGKSQSFTSLSDVKCVEDLAKKESPYRRKMKPCKSYGGLDETQKCPSHAPGPCSKTIMKKPSRSPCVTMLATGYSNSFLSRPPRHH